MKMKIEKSCRNCDNICNKHKQDCADFVLCAEAHELAHELDYSGIEIIPPSKTIQQNYKKQNNQFLYNSKVEDWKNKHLPIWRLKLKLNQSEWVAVKHLFKYYKNKNLVGWGTISPVEVSEILTNLRGTCDAKELLNEINSKIEIAKNGQKSKNYFSKNSEKEDIKYLQELEKQKKELLGVI